MGLTGGEKTLGQSEIFLHPPLVAWPRNPRLLNREKRQALIVREQVSVLRNCHRAALEFAVWRIAESAAKTGQTVDLRYAADELCHRYPASGRETEEVIRSLERAAVKTRAPIYSDRGRVMGHTNRTRKLSS